MPISSNDEVRRAVRDRYGRIARGQQSSGCCSPDSPACGGVSHALGYSDDALERVPQGADMGLGCGNPHAIAALETGETVLDLGSGGGLDCFLAAECVGASGRVVGVDMTPDMVAKARSNAVNHHTNNVQFRLGEIEHLPVADGSVDVILSNCVINLSPDKAAVFADAYRVLKPGGRLAISDMVTIAPLPAAILADVEALTGCVAGAASVETIQTLLAQAGFTSIEVTVRPESRDLIARCFPGRGAEDCIASATIAARKAADAPVRTGGAHA